MIKILFKTERDFDHFCDSEMDAWNDASIDALRGIPARSSHPVYMDGYNDGLRARRRRVVMPARPEGYYHVAPGAL
jgi:hypothetical protein